MRRAWIAVVGVALFGCGPATPEQQPNVSTYAQTTYHWHFATQRDPLAATIVLDTSAPMLEPFDPSDSACPVGCGAAAPCPSSCRTNFEAARDALQSTLAMHPADFRWGLVVPPESGCGAPQTDLAPISLEAADVPQAQLRASEAIALALGQLTPTTQAPLALTLRTTAALPTMNEQNSVMVLVTAGRDACTVGSPGCAAACDSSSDVQAAIAEAQAHGVQTSVIGVGAAAFRATAAAELDTLARLGGLPRGCFDSTDCGADACGADHVCSRAFSGIDALARFFEPVLSDPWQPCTLGLPEPPQRLEWMTVRANDELLAPGANTWTLDTNRPAIQLEGATCEQAKQASTRHPLSVEVRILDEVR